MSFETKIQENLKAAMKSKDQAALRALRAVKSAILLAKTDKGGAAEISDDDGIKIVQKLVKQRNESIKIYQDQGRADLAKDEIDEVSVLEDFLPKQMSTEELEDLVKSIIAKTGAQNKADMGKVMGIIKSKAEGRADMGKISGLIKQRLTA
ncbi:MAG: GatB/YqeY domain-containing protein [Bacteroidia bacterium]